MTDNSIDTAEIEGAELARLDIERVPSETFLWNGYRYGNAGDAVAAARREEKK